MKVETFTGNSFEIGKQLGKIYKKNGMKLDATKVDKELLEKQKKIYQEYYPEILEELKGINEILKIDEDKLFFFFLAAELDWFRKTHRAKACTIFGVKSKNGFFVGRNYDWLKVAEKHLRVFKTQNLGKNAYLGVTDMAVYNRNPDIGYLMHYEDDAINEKGLFIGLNFALTYKWNYGLRPAHMIKLISQNCNTVDEALEMFETVPLCIP